MVKSITISDPDIVEFYTKNPHLNIADVNRTFIDILKTLSTDLTKTLENSKLGKLNSAITTLREDIQSMKKEYADEMKKIVDTNSLQEMEKVSLLVERNTNLLTSSLIDKTTNILNDVIPKNQAENQKHIEGIIREFHNNISADTKRLLESNEREDSDVKKMIDNINNNFSSLTNQLQQPIFSIISTTEERMNKKLDSLKEDSVSQTIKSDKLGEELLDFLNKFKNNSQVKGAVSENMLYSVLQQVFPCDNIKDCRSLTASGDFIVMRMDKRCPTIMFENKDYNKTINTDEVTKFERDIKMQKCHGIFLSQFSPITFKKNFHVDIIDGLIHVYVPNAEFSAEKIQIAVDIVDSLAVKLEILQKNKEDNSTSISAKELTQLADEYREYASKRESMIEYIKLTNKDMLERMEQLTLPSFRSMLASNGAIDSEIMTSLTCQFCKSYVAKSKQSVAAHSRRCKHNPKSPLYEDASIQQGQQLEDSLEIELDV